MWRSTTTNLLLLCLGATLPLPLAAQEVPQAFVDEALRHGLRAVVSPESQSVCETLHNRFLSVGEAMGYDRLRRSVFASKAVHSLAAGLAAGEANDFVDVTAVAAYAGTGKANDEPRYLATASLLGEGIGLAKAPLLIMTTDDLKYLPFQQMNTDILIVTASATDLTKSRAERVAALAANLNIRVSTLWTGDEPSALHAAAATPLAWLAAATGGRFVSFSAEACVKRL